jgi:hypothetical protein
MLLPQKHRDYEVLRRLSLKSLLLAKRAAVATALDPKILPRKKRPVIQLDSGPGCTGRRKRKRKCKRRSML